MSQQWNLWFAEYLILDGWGDVHVGRELNSSGLCFWSLEPLRKSAVRHKFATAIADFGYLANAEVVFRSEKACVIDFGLLAVGTSDQLPRQAKASNYVTGPVLLSVDRMEALPAEVEATIPLYKWRVDGITADATPYISRPVDSRMLIRDESRLRYEAVQSTGAFSQEMRREHSMRGDFVLHCARIGP